MPSSRCSPIRSSARRSTWCSPGAATPTVRRLRGVVRPRHGALPPPGRRRRRAALRGGRGGRARTRLEAQDPLALNTVAAERGAAVDHPASTPTTRRAASSPPSTRRTRSATSAWRSCSTRRTPPTSPCRPRDWCSGNQPGTHGALHVRQARAPLWFSGRGRRGRARTSSRPGPSTSRPRASPRSGFPTVDGVGPAGRAVRRDVLPRPPGRPRARRDPRPRRAGPDAAVRVPDGRHAPDRAGGPPGPRPATGCRTCAASASGRRCWQGGSMVNFPSITWPSHTAIVTGALVRPPRRGQPHLLPARASARPCRRRVCRSAPSGSPTPPSRACTRRSTACAPRRRSPPPSTRRSGARRSHAVLEGRNLCDRRG